MKKEAFISFYSKKSTEHEVLHKLVKATCTITELNLDLKEIDGKAFDGRVYINGPDTQGMLIKNGRVLLLHIYVLCYGHVLNPTLQDTTTQIEPLCNILGTIQALCNFSGAIFK